MIFIFSFLLFSDIEIGNDHFDYLGNVIYQSFRAPLQSELSSSSWFFINFPYLDKIDCKEKLTSEHGFSLDYDSVITSRTCLAFLSPDNISTLQLYYKNKREKVNIQLLKSSEKLHNVNNNLDLNYIARFHSSFTPPQNLRGKLTKLSNEVYLYTIQKDSKKDILNEILSLPSLRSISPQKPPKLMNRWNSGFIQKNEWPGGYDIYNTSLNASEILSKGDLRVNRYFNDRGLNGTGQIITIVDSGLDLNSPYFADKSDKLFEYEKVNRWHRKVVYYSCFGNDHDTRDMHGTHVAGIVAGSPTFSEENISAYQKLSLYNGVAFGSKLAVVDVTENDNSGTTVLNYPSILLGEVMGKVDSKVALCAFGNPSNTEQSYYYDMLAESNPRRLFVVAAGNSGPRYMSVSSPGEGKNVLTVGALEAVWTSRLERAREYVLNGQHKMKVSKFGSDLFYEGNFLIDGVKTVTSLTDILEGEEKVLVTSSPNFCEAIKDVKSGNLPKAVIFVGEIFSESSCAENSPFAFPIFTSTDKEILDYQTVTVKITIDYDGQLNNTIFDLNVAQYSSRGPNYVGIQKPDVVAPGSSIYSADAAFVSPSDGTSNAAAYVAGAAALVYEYFERGFYPSGKANSSNSFVPTSDLVRALIVASAEPVSAGQRTPDSLSGHGLVNLASVVTFGRNMKVFAQIRVGNEQHFFTRFTIKKKDMNDLDLRIATAYKDPSSTNNYLALQTNIDMYLVLPNGTIVYGSHRPEETEERFSTVERILIYNEEIRQMQANSDNESDVYELHFVTGSGFSSLPHSAIFSLFISGPFINEDESIEEAIELHQASSFAKEETKKEFKFIMSSKNKCTFPSFGVNCQQNVTEIPLINQTQFNMYSSTAKLLYINIPLNYTRMLLHLRREPSFAGRLGLQFAINNIYEYGTNYPLIVSVNGGSSTISLQRSMFGANKYVGIRISNMVGTDLKVWASMTYEEAIPAQTPTRSAEATMPKSVVIHMSVSYGLFGLFLIPVIVFSILICCFKKKIKNNHNLTNILLEQSNNVDEANDSNKDIGDQLLKGNAL